MISCLFRFVPGVVAACMVWGFSLAAAEGGRGTWWKGNLHTHSLWSDGDDFPEMIVRWYKANGYHFLALSDHNVLASEGKWMDAWPTNRAGGAVLEKYRAAFGDRWVERRMVEGVPQVRLRSLEEFRSKFDERGRFLLVPAMELTDRHLVAPVHINVTNVRELIPPQGGTSVVEVMQRNVSAVMEQRRRTGQPMFPHINHPNFGWAITAEELMQVRDERFFEVYNGHPAVHNEGDETHAGTERMWDIVLTWRLAKLNLGVMFGVATDDSHHYHETGPTKSNTGRGWVMVRSARLAAAELVNAMEAGEFYASSGVTLERVVRGPRAYEVSIAPEPGVSYTTEFIGTRRGFDERSTPVPSALGAPLRVTHRYSPDVGAVLARVTGSRAVYQPVGDEIYVRARVTSSKPKANGIIKDEVECAWAQPWVPSRR